MTVQVHEYTLLLSPLMCEEERLYRQARAEAELWALAGAEKTVVTHAVLWQFGAIRFGAEYWYGRIVSHEHFSAAMMDPLATVRPGLKEDSTMANNTVLATYPLTATGRAAALGALDKLGKGNESLIETEDALIAAVYDYEGDEAAAGEHFAGANIRHNTVGAKAAPKAGKDTGQFEPTIEIAGQIVQVPASSREPQAPPEVDDTSAVATQDEGAPDTATEPSPHLSGAAQGQARRDKAKANKE